MADETLTGSVKEVSVDTDALATKKKKIIKYVIIVVVVIAAYWLAKKYLL